MEAVAGKEEAGEVRVGRGGNGRQGDENERGR